MVRQRKSTVKNQPLKSDEENSKAVPAAKIAYGYLLAPFRFAWKFAGMLKWLLLLLLAAPLVNYASLKNEQTLLLPEDALHYDIGYGQRLMLRCTGKGSPTVILENPAGVSSDIWTGLRLPLSKLTRVCVYDRAGIGFSDRPAPELDSTGEGGDATTSPPRSQMFTVERMADDLKHLVNGSSSQPLPFILIGLELGALAARFYSQMYDSHIHHVILIDPLTADLFNHASWMEHWRTDILHNIQVEQMTGAVGINRLTLLTGLSELPQLWTRVKDSNVTSRQKHLLCHPRHLKSAVDESAGILDSLQQLKTLNMVKPLSSSLNYSVMYRRNYNSWSSQQLQAIWKEAGEGLASSLQIPPAQVSVIPTKSDDTYGSVSGPTLTTLRKLIREIVHKYRKERHNSTA